MAVEVLNQISELLAGLDLAAVPGTELGACLVGFDRVESQVEAIKLECTTRFDKAGGWADDGALGLAPWLRSRTGASATAAYRQVRTARALQAAPVLRQAFRAGELSTAQLRLLAPLALGDTAGLFARDEPVLIAEAKTATAEASAQMVRYWRALADDELGRPDQIAEQLEANQSLRVSETFQGAVVADMQLAPVEGAIWRDELDRLTEELWQASSEQERADVGVSRRRAAAQVEMAKRSAEWRADQTGRLVPLFVGVVDLDVLEGRTGRACQTDRGGRITPQAVHDWLDGADFAPLITGPGGVVLHFGRTRRIATRKQRQAVAIRDGHCTFPGCDRPAGYADVHHLVPWEAGGGTDVDNLALLCHHHHHHTVHQAGFTPSRDDQGQLWWRRPNGTLIPEPLRDWNPTTSPPPPFNQAGGSGVRPGPDAGDDGDVTRAQAILDPVLRGDTDIVGTGGRHEAGSRGTSSPDDIRAHHRNTGDEPGSDSGRPANADQPKSDSRQDNDDVARMQMTADTDAMDSVRRPDRTGEGNRQPPPQRPAPRPTSHDDGPAS
jgi:hypothetical protein